MLKLNSFLCIRLNPVMVKIKLLISGRVFKWCLYKNKISFFFIHSNKKRFFLNNNFRASVFKKSKTNIFFLFFSKFNLNPFFKNINFVKKINVFTKRGIVVKESLFFKKKGKISSYSVECLTLFFCLKNTTISVIFFLTN